MASFTFTSRFPWRAVAAASALAAGLLAGPAHAALFEDDEARRAILELRQRADAQRQTSDRQSQDTEQLRRSLLDLQSQIEALRGDVARLTGQNEQLQRDIADLQRRQKDIVQGVDDRLRKVEPAKVTVDGREFTADPRESADYEAALAIFRKGDFPSAQAAFTQFLQRYPQSGFRPTALFWLGNAQYANRDYKGAIGNFRTLLSSAADNPRAPEALLSIANCQIELKDNTGARRTLDELMRTYPQSEAAGAARERLAKLR
ncbi:tol-pal system protein YbgF [Ramlibacter aquaticus]|uniref:Cell division coordinator CpoB n=2 Tax=Comamonadaceae TaxID=80864 RepID=A0ABR9SBZ8_9BURK|nr:tol-pal system protein YbgF [Ramlibacter aquaticus]